MLASFDINKYPRLKTISYFLFLQYQLMITKEKNHGSHLDQ